MTLLPLNKRCPSYLLDDLKEQMIRGKGPWLAGNVSLEYDGKVIVTSAQALQVMLEKTETVYHMISVMAKIIMGQRQEPLMMHSKEHDKLFLIITQVQKEHADLKRRIQADYNIKYVGVVVK